MSETLIVSDTPLVGTIKKDPISGSNRMLVTGKDAGLAYDSDCCLDAVVTLALMKQGIDPRELRPGQQLAVTVRVLDNPAPAVTFHNDDYVPRERA